MRWEFGNGTIVLSNSLIKISSNTSHLHINKFNKNKYVPSIHSASYRCILTDDHKSLASILVHVKPGK